MNPEMDAILDAALDDLDEDDDSEDATSHDTDCHNCGHSDNALPSVGDDVKLRRQEDGMISPLQSPIASIKKKVVDTSPTAEFQNLLRAFIEADDGDAVDGKEDGEKRLKNFMSQVESKLLYNGNGSGNGSTTNERQPPRKSPNNLDDAMSSLMEGMAKVATMENGDDVPSIENDGDEDALLKSMFEQFQGAESGDGAGFDTDAMIDGMMEQLLSKELMYEPMKQVAQKFPQWLQDHKDNLEPEEYSMREKQCGCFQKLVEMYETKPDNTRDLIELMQEVQEFGQPPQEIINDIAPGLELDQDGMPKINPLDTLGNEECCVM